MSLWGGTRRVESEGASPRDIWAEIVPMGLVGGVHAWMALVVMFVRKLVTVDLGLPRSRETKGIGCGSW
jgi:hypothetical protein